MISTASQHVVAMIHMRPAVADDVLIQSFTRAQRQREATFAHQADRRGGLRDNGRVIANDGTGQSGGSRGPVVSDMSL